MMAILSPSTSASSMKWVVSRMVRSFYAIPTSTIETFGKKIYSTAMKKNLKVKKVVFDEKYAN